MMLCGCNTVDYWTEKCSNVRPLKHCTSTTQGKAICALRWKIILPRCILYMYVCVVFHSNLIISLEDLISKKLRQLKLFILISHLRSWIYIVFPSRNVLFSFFLLPCVTDLAHCSGAGLLTAGYAYYGVTSFPLLVPPLCWLLAVSGYE